MQTLVEGGLVQLWGPPDRRTGVGLDLLFADDALSREVLGRATPVEVDGVPIPVASPEDLILMKLDANRPTDLDDVIALRDAFDASLDRAYLTRMAIHLGIEARVAAFIGP
jgi:predicted nucleotidyltransferase